MAAEDVTVASATREEPAPAPLVSSSEPLVPQLNRRDRARASAYRMRFAIVYVVLAALLGAAGGTFVVLVTRPATPDGPAWSDWRPEGSRDRMTKQIADHVGRGYTLPSGNQLAAVYGGPPAVQGVSVRAIAVRPDTSTGAAEEDDIDVLDASSSTMYVLCGLGTQCSIPEGEPSEARHRLLRREALELSLYTFKYVDGVDSVTVLLPPPPPADAEGAAAPEPGTAVFLEKSDLREELDRPLSHTFVHRDPPALGEIDQREVVRIEQLTRPRLYQYEFQQAQEGNAILILSPLLLDGG